MSTVSDVQRVRLRIWVLWACVGLFFLRVIGQIEALLLSPSWLPPMQAWYSGLLPYVYVLGTFLAVFSLHHGATGRAVGYFVLLSFVIAEVCNQTARIVYHRRGS